MQSLDQPDSQLAFSVKSKFVMGLSRLSRVYVSQMHHGEQTHVLSANRREKRALLDEVRKQEKRPRILEFWSPEKTIANGRLEPKRQCE